MINHRIAYNETRVEHNIKKLEEKKNMEGRKMGERHPMIMSTHVPTS
jgi:hypothetical protein